MSPLNRRDLLRSAGVLAFAGVATTTGRSEAAQAASPTGAAVPGFQHGVASGDPLPSSVLLWTRVTPTTEAVPGSGIGPDVTVRWEVAEDSGFLRMAARGSVRTGSARDHTVKVVPGGLRPGTAYWYRFIAAGATSPTGRTRTAPAAGAAVDRLRMGVVSCANWQAGYFSAYRYLADRGDLDVVLHLGDYLYEYAPGEYQARDIVVRPHDPAVEMTTLSHYRRRHAQYKTDLDLQALHSAVPFVVTWDDHEFANDAWSGGAENHTEGAEGTWSARRAWSQQAYAEWMPVRFEPAGHIYRRFEYGSLASISMLDLRTYRSQQASSVVDPAIASPARTLTGDAQMAWLLDGFSSQKTQWKLIGNPVMITPVRFPSTLSAQEIGAVGQLLGSTTIDGVPYNVDQWDGYSADRSRVISHLRDNAITDTVFLTGDIHSGWACDVPADPLTYPSNGASVAAELVCTSVTSDNLDDILGTQPRTASVAVEEAFKGANPHVKHLDFDSHGFSVLEVTPGALRMDWYVLSERTSRAATSALSASWQVAAGTQSVSRIL
ncbi:alkaline phosphatase D family protein [Cryobacterium psychrophilum]|uniref:Alkaline phosphatase n=1 Tax=Cryobacterium psychrophilum TaxID=41988 RepID=A0A4Y8KMY0_9MICO|nr:alkaline phosphatase D family protein [Cryobacterium psychrophilum]TDW31138.1 alkaline phosphatase D [Cryobacterium psychrophilum]TFD78565.1 alkaline phosphatase [Cryobacterium psychrophilum]